MARYRPGQTKRSPVQLTLELSTPLHCVGILVGPGVLVRWVLRVECWISLPQRRELTRSVYRSTYAPAQAIRRYVAATNAEPKRLSEPRPLMRSWLTSPDSVDEFLT